MKIHTRTLTAHKTQIDSKTQTNSYTPIYTDSPHKYAQTHNTYKIHIRIDTSSRHTETQTYNTHTQAHIHY